VRIQLDKLGNGKHRFHVQCLTAENDSSRLAGPGVVIEHLVNRTLHVAWSLRKTRNWFSSRTEVVVQPERDLEGVDRFVLVTKVNRMPAKITDGDSILEWEPEPGEHAREVQVPKSGEGTIFCRLFAEPGEGITMIDPPIDECSL
jgi:hypothetical protein